MVRRRQRDPVEGTEVIPVIDRYARGWPDHGSASGAAVYGDIAEVFTTAYPFDAHFAAYSNPAVPHRLTHRAIEATAAIAMTLLVVDVEPEGHAPRTDAWDLEQAPRIATALDDGAYYYETRGGYRLVWRLEQPFVIRTRHDAERWKASYTAALEALEADYGIVGDRTCKDWTRLYRLPFVVRDGQTQEPETSDVNAMRTLSLRIVDVPEPTALSAIAADHDRPPASPELLEHIRQRLKQHGPAVEGRNGDQHTFVACAMVTRGYALSDAEAVALLDEWNATCQPPWDGGELRTKMDNAYNYGQGDIGEARREWEGDQRVYRGLGVTPPSAQRTTTPTTPAAPRSLVDSATTVAAGLTGLLGIITAEPDWPATLAGNIIAAFATDKNPYAAVLEAAAVDVANYVGATKSAPLDERPFFESASSLFKGDYKPPAWLVQGLVLEGGITMIGAEAKASKTWLGTEIAVALATGTAVCGESTWRAKQMNVAYFYTEDMRDAIKSRVMSLLAGRKLGLEALGDRFHAQPRGKKIDITKLDDCARIIASARMIERQHGKLGVLALDPLRNIHLRDEDKSGEMAVVFENLKMIGTLLDCTIVIVHHSKKQTQNGSKRGGQKLRGSSAIHGFLDSAIYLSDTRTSDDASSITNTVESETKTGKAAGVFELTIKIKDHESNRTAEEATWTVSRGDKAKASKSEADVETLAETAYTIVDAFYEHKMARGSTKMTVAAIAKGAKVAKNTAIAAMQSVAVRQGWITQGKHGTYTLTPAGESMSRERHAAPTAPMPPSGTPHPAAAFVDS